MIISIFLQSFWGTRWAGMSALVRDICLCFGQSYTSYLFASDTWYILIYLDTIKIHLNILSKWSGFQVERNSFFSKKKRFKSGTVLIKTVLYEWTSFFTSRRRILVKAKYHLVFIYIPHFFPQNKCPLKIFLYLAYFQ